MRALIEERAQALEQYYEGLTGCHVVIETGINSNYNQFIVLRRLGSSPSPRRSLQRAGQFEVYPACIGSVAPCPAIGSGCLNVPLPAGLLMTCQRNLKMKSLRLGDAE